MLEAFAPDRLEAALSRRESGEPLAHILGRTQFRGLELAIGPGVFVPRPRAEALLEVELGNPRRVLDLGCGCGALAAALKRLLPEAEVHASDIDEGCLHFARVNARRYGYQVHCSDWLSELPEPFELIVAYFPHVPEAERAGLDQDYLRAEGPRSVLGGMDGLDPLRAVLADLKNHGRLLTLLQADQLAAARELVRVVGGRLKECGGDEMDRVVEIVCRPAGRARTAPP
ncbi:MAG: methyltransferase [Vulcanimicrobiota bacterium]